MTRKDRTVTAAARSIGRGYLAPEIVRQRLRTLARTAPERADVTPRQARAWLADLWRLQAEGAFFFCVNRFLFSAVRLRGAPRCAARGFSAAAARTSARRSRGS